MFQVLLVGIVPIFVHPNETWLDLDGALDFSFSLHESPGMELELQLAIYQATELFKDEHNIGKEPYNFCKKTNGFSNQ